MRKGFVLMLALAGCTASRLDLVEKLHLEHQEVQSSESAELPYRAKTPDLGALRGEKRADLVEELGPGLCEPGPVGKRCTWPFSTGQGDDREAPLLLRVDFDAADACVAAAWALAE